MSKVITIEIYQSKPGSYVHAAAFGVRSGGFSTTQAAVVGLLTRLREHLDNLVAAADDLSDAGKEKLATLKGVFFET